MTTLTTPVSYDFSDNLSSLKTWMQAQEEFKDFNFDGAAITELLRVLAYNEQNAAFRNNFMFNEMDIRSANLQQNVSAIAAAFSYTPTSQIGAVIPINIVVTPDDITTAPSQITLSQNNSFYSSIDGVSYTFYPLTSTTVSLDSSTGTYTFNNIILKQGSWVYNSYPITSSNSVESFTIPNTNIDTTTLNVVVFPSSTSTTFTTWNKVTSGYDLGASNNVYFLRYNRKGYYEIEFGDGSLGAKPPFGSTVVISYMITDGAAANSISTVSAGGSIGGYYNINITQIDSTTSYGGAAIEDIETTRQAAPYIYQTIGNAVTYLDYIALTKQLFSEASDVVAYGGEEAEPPKYGYVIVAVKPKSTLTLTTAQKASLISTLSKVNVGSITPIIVDPQYIFVDPTITYNFTKKKSILTQQGIDSKVSKAITTYNSSYLGLFDADFDYTNLLSYCSNIDSSISSLVISIGYHQQFTPELNVTGVYSFNFNRSIKSGSVSIKGFRIADTNYSGYTYYIADVSGVLNLYKTDGTNITTITSGVGTVNYTTGVVNITSFTPNSILDGSYCYVYASPDTLDQGVTSKNQNIIEIGNVTINSTVI